MISSNESTHCRKILNLLDKESLFSIKDTLTKGMIMVADEQEAIDVILEYSKNATELLSRRKLKRDILLKYAFQEKINVNPDSSKGCLIGVILDHVNGTSKSLSGVSALNIHSSGANPSMAIKNAASDIYCHQVASNIAETDQEIAKQFITWFYPMLNSLSGTSDATSCEWKVGHFWPECTLRCKLPANECGQGEGFTFESYEGAAMTEKRLSSFVRDSKFLFNVNDTPNGYRGCINEHGMAKVACCGTVHKYLPVSEMFATFEQVFGLLRDPLEENRWKIKFSDISFQFLTRDISETPSLSLTALNAIMQS